MRRSCPANPAAKPGACSSSQGFDDSPHPHAPAFDARDRRKIEMNLSRLLASATAFFVLAAASGPASADGAATCDPTNALECQQIALNYTLFNAPPFPVDPDRADALARLAVDGALEGCAGANYTLCYTLGDEALPLAADADPERYSLAARVAAYRSLTEAGCERGDPEACYWRSVLYKVDPSIIAMGIET